jgi:hypothetical protein
MRLLSQVQGVEVWTSSTFGVFATKHRSFIRWFEATLKSSGGKGDKNEPRSLASTASSSISMKRLPLSQSLCHHTEPIVLLLDAFLLYIVSKNAAMRILDLETQHMCPTIAVLTCLLYLSLYLLSKVRSVCNL